jgi:hypothetical protein
MFLGRVGLAVRRRRGLNRSLDLRPVLRAPWLELTGEVGSAAGAGGRLSVAALKVPVDLLAVDLYLRRCGDADPYGVTVDFEHGDDDVVPDQQALLRAAAEDKHEASFGRGEGEAAPNGSD